MRGPAGVAQESAQLPVCARMILLISACLLVCSFDSVSVSGVVEYYFALIQYLRVVFFVKKQKQKSACGIALLISVCILIPKKKTISSPSLKIREITSGCRNSLGSGMLEYVDQSHHLGIDQLHRE